MSFCHHFTYLSKVGCMCCPLSWKEIVSGCQKSSSHNKNALSLRMEHIDEKMCCKHRAMSVVDDPVDEAYPSFDGISQELCSYRQVG